MPEPPPVGFITRFVLENPWPLGVGLVLVGAVMAFLALRDGRLDRAKFAVLPVAAGLVVLVLGLSVTTSGEHARATVRAFVERVAASDVSGAVDLLADDVTLHVAAATNVGRDRDVLTAELSRFDGAYSIESNTITKLGGYTETADRATVHLACLTYVDRGLGYPNATQWVLQVARQEDGTWKIDRLVFVSLNGRPAPGNW